MIYEFRDPLYGFIYVDDLEKKIIDSSAFQRLRNIKQLGMTYLVYPGATHTRFEHSLGTMEAASRMFDNIVSKNDNKEILKWGKEDINYFRKILRLSALLHDIGHLPFSHSAERELMPKEMGFENHEDYTYAIIKDFYEITKIIESDLGKEESERIASIAASKHLEKEDEFLNSLIAGELGADRIDYLIRDSHHIGVYYGRFDYHRLFQTLLIRKTENENIQLAIEEGGAHTVEGMILARYFMFKQVYFHKTRRILDIHLSDFLKKILSNNRFPCNISEFLKWDDNQIYNLIKENKDDILTSRFMKRNHFREAWHTVDHPKEEQLVKFEKLKERILKRFPNDKIKIDEAQKDPYNYRKPIILVRKEIPRIPRQFVHIREISPLIDFLLPINKKRIYSEKDIKNEVSKFCLDFQ